MSEERYPECGRGSVERLVTALEEALAYIRACEIREIVPRSDGPGYREAQAALKDHRGER